MWFPVSDLALVPSHCALLVKLLFSTLFNTLIRGESLNTRTWNLSSRNSKHCFIVWCKIYFHILNRIHGSRVCLGYISLLLVIVCISCWLLLVFCQVAWYSSQMSLTCLRHKNVKRLLDRNGNVARANLLCFICLVYVSRYRRHRADVRGCRPFPAVGGVRSGSAQFEKTRNWGQMEKSFA